MDIQDTPAEAFSLDSKGKEAWREMAAFFKALL